MLPPPPPPTTHTHTHKKSIRRNWLKVVGGGGGGEGNLGIIVVLVCEPVYRNLSHSYNVYLAFEKNGPIRILDRQKRWPIHILPFDLFYLLTAGS